MENEILIYLDLHGTVHLVGRMWTHMRQGRESASFEYEKSWLNLPERFSLEPALTIGPGQFHTATGRAIFESMGDSAPDRWGRLLMRRAERHRAHQAKETPRTLREIDYLLGVDDEARQGALRFATKLEGSFLAVYGTKKIPPLIGLPKLLSATERIISETESDRDLRLLLAPGSSLGGARPKASIRDKDGSLAIAKFPSKDDETSVVLWEALALMLAEKAGISVPVWRLENIMSKPVLIIRRFDREGSHRIPFLSAMSMLGARDNDTRSYLELVDVLRKYGTSPAKDMEALWRRIVFNILVSNTDDHLRNHGFLWHGPSGWKLSPAYDLNPVPSDIKPRILSTNIDLHDGTASLKLALEVASYFDISSEKAHIIALEVGQVVTQWKKLAAKLGLSSREMSRMESSFEHQDLQQALSFSQKPRLS